MSMTPIRKGIRIDELDSLGSFGNLPGIEIIEGGDVQAYARMTHGAPTDAISAGYFGTSKGKYRVVYPFAEQSTVVTGEVRITDVSSGKTTHYQPGDSWFVTKGSATVWEVLTDGFVKHYLAFG
ncbi:MAG: DUF861 domain-containing protein [Gammaproteobacteria bacterium]|nr:DUF861 domain-containing protein [Gammaproteobacteria bacterium]